MNRRRPRRHRSRELIEAPDNRIRREGTLIGFTAYRAPLYTWWSSEAEAWGLFELPG